MTVTLTKHLPQRRRPPTNPGGPPATEVAACRAAVYTNALWQAAQATPPVLVMDWRGHPSGIACAPLEGGGRLVHVPGGQDTSLLAQLPCSQGVVHETPIRWPSDLDTALQAAADCRDHTPPAEDVNELTTGLLAAAERILDQMRAAKGGADRG